MTIRRLALALPLVLAGWLGTMAAIMLVSDAAPGAVALWPSAGFVGALPDGVAVVGGSPVSVTVRSDMPRLGPALYAAGARLVLPAGLPGCLPLPGG
ncbi:hypothetical protein DXV76_16730 [Rhodobacteraceae bacterium CCMM004]|nr:hypothetical protein DXV76_16730 [Rhodobacteraceae bacterium CCMM004]